MAVCYNCDYFDPNDTYGSIFDSVKKYRCKKKNGCVYSDDSYVYADYLACCDFKAKGSSDCYITTIVCEMLGYPDDCDLLQTLRNYRDNYLKKNLDRPEYLYLLREYDVVGPEISKMIRMEGSHSQCEGLLDYFLIPCVEAIKKNNYEEAVIIYKNLVFHLNGIYDLPYLPIPTCEKIDIELLGKARTRVKN